MNKSLVGLVLLGCYICLFSTYYFDFCLYPSIPIYTKNTYLSTFIQNLSERSACTSAYEVDIKLCIIFSLFLPETLCWKKKLWQLKIYLKFPLTPMGVLAPVSAQRDTPLSPPLTSAEIFRRTCLQSSLKKNLKNPGGGR